jgi:hypothetical protein
MLRSHPFTAQLKSGPSAQLEHYPTMQFPLPTPASGDIYYKL